MSDSKERTSTLDPTAPVIIVKGGTTSAEYDRQRAEQQHLAEVGRAHQDKQMAAAASGDRLTEEGFISSRLHSLRMMDSGAPKVVFYYMNRDRSVRQECVGEILVTGDRDELFVLVCPRCLERGEPHGSAQLMVKKSHRKWHLDLKHGGEVKHLRDPFGRPFEVRICGTIHVEDIVRCSNFNCNWAVRIEDSKVYEV